MNDVIYNQSNYLKQKNMQYNEHDIKRKKYI